MPVVTVEDAGDPRIADYRGIPDPELARAHGVFVAEGRLVVRRLLASSFTTRSVMVTSAAMDALAGCLEQRPSLPVYVVAQHVMNTVAGFHLHRGCLAIGVRPAPAPWESVVQAGLKACSHTVVALERVGNADNVGATFRAAAAFGAAGVLLDGGCTDPLYRKAIRTSMGAALQVPFAADVPLSDAFAALSRDGWAVVGLTPAAGAPPARDVFEALGADPVVLVLGHEGDGLSAPTAAACTHLARIPMRSNVDSLNVAMAAGIALYERRQARPA